MSTDDRWLQLKTACDKFDISYSALYAAVKSGAFGEDHIQSGTRHRVKESAVLTWLKGQAAS